MPITASAEPLTFVAADSVAALPDTARALLEAAGRQEFAFGADWYANVLAHGLPADCRPCLLAIRRGQRTLAILPMRRDGPGAGALASLTTPYTCVYAPIVDPALDSISRSDAFATAGRFLRRWPIVRLDAMPAEWPGLADLRAGLRRARLVSLPFEHFGNWHESVAGVSWAVYLATRAGELRATINRRLRRAERDPNLTITVTDTTEGLDHAIAAFEYIYARSWKEPEPFPDFNAGLMRAAAGRGLLRLGVLRIAGIPAATQLWIVEPSRIATVHKLAHDEAHKAASPGTVLAAVMIRRLLDQERVVALDYGRGDDAYKKLWTRERRRRIGLIVANPLRPAGGAAVARYLAASIGRRVSS